MNQKSNGKSEKQSAIFDKKNQIFPRHVGIAYSEVKREYFPTDAQYETEKNAKRDAIIISEYLQKLGVEVSLYPGDARLPERLKKDKPDFVFNLVDSVKGNEYLSSTIPAVLELLDIPYTGAGILGVSLDHNKFIVKKLFEQNGIPIPHYQLFNASSDPLDSTLRFPLISKLNGIHGAVEITEDAVSDNEKHLRKRLKYLIKTYDQPVLVEEFIVGKEITAIQLESLNKKVYLAEKVFTKKNSKYIFATFDDQWVTNTYDTFHYEKYQDLLLVEYVKRAFDMSSMDDYGKFDIRFDSSGRYYFLDSNCNPAFGPKENACAISVILDLYKITFQDILKKLLLNTVNDVEKKQIPQNGFININSPPVITP